MKVKKGPLQTERTSLERLQPPYQAVAHGCQAGLYVDTLAFFKKRVRRTEETLDFTTMRTLSADLPALMMFLEPSRDRCRSGLSTSDDQAYVLAATGIALLLLGRLEEAKTPLDAGLKLSLVNGLWQRAASCIIPLCGVEILQGDLSEALARAQRGVELTRGKDRFLESVAIAIRGNVLHQCGRISEAREDFEAAEKLHGELFPEASKTQPYALNFLDDLRGWWYCELMLTDRKQSDVKERASQLVERQQKYPGLLYLPMHFLSLGRSYFGKILGGDRNDLDIASGHVDTAVKMLAASGLRIYLPVALLSRAFLRFQKGDAEGARSDLEEALKIAESGPLSLYMAEIYLNRARLFMGATPYPWDSPQADLAAARKFIEECGYGRRKEELEAAERAAGLR